MKTLYLFVLIFIGHIVAWFHSNSAILLKEYSFVAIISSLTLAPLSGLIFVYGTKYLYELTGSIWSVRFISFCIGYFAFIPLAWYFYGETPISTKNIICCILCVGILVTQYLMR